MCPITCEIVKQAIEEHERTGCVMQEYIDAHKEYDESCQWCSRNEKALDFVKDMQAERKENG